LGHTGIRVSALGFGGGAFAGLLVRGDERQQNEAVARAVAGGITYFDTAAQYGDGLSEENLGRALAEAEATSRVVIGTKVRLGAEDLAAPDAAVRGSLQGSLRRLQRDYVDAFVLHNFPRSTTARDGVMVEQLAAIAAAMRSLQQQGLVRCIGLTGVGETEAVLGAIETGLFDFVQCYCNVLNPSALYCGAAGGGQDFRGAFALAAAAGQGAMSVRTMAGGALAASDYRAPLAGPRGFGSGLGGATYDNDLERAARLQPLAADAGCDSVLELGVRFMLSPAAVSTALIGFSDLEQVESALRWSERGPLADDVIERAVELARAGAVTA
jgi:L-galactose dehydrogenase/L-glyceraldehyde 3-phosphate reductase